MKTWRLLDTPPMSAADNMAMDQTLLELKGSGKSPDTIRFLQFKPRSVLVGYHQAIQEEIRMGYCRENNIDVNRRITGGGAIFFDEKGMVATSRHHRHVMGHFTWHGPGGRGFTAQLAV